MAGNYDLGMRCSERESRLVAFEKISQEEIEWNWVKDSGRAVIGAVDKVVEGDFQGGRYPAQRSFA